MRAVILCPGPSLALYPGRTDEQLVLGVNRAAILHPVDVWVAMDWTSEGTNRTPGGVRHWQADVQGSPRLVTGTESAAMLASHGAAWRGETITCRDFLAVCPTGYGWTLFSATAALVYAVHSGAKRIRCYGIDWAGELDVDGVRSGGNRRPERWQHERDIWQNLLVPWCTAHGASVERIVRDHVAG